MIAALALAVQGSPSAGPKPLTERTLVAKLRVHVNGIRLKKCLPPLPIRERIRTMTRAEVSTQRVAWQRRHVISHAAPQGDPWPCLERGNFDVVLARAARLFGVSFGWLHACSHSEGNTHFRGPIWNNSGSGAFGWMQFMSGTFYANVGPAFAGARARDEAIPVRYRSWSSKVGQAYTAAWMFAIGQSRQWTGAGC